MRNDENEEIKEYLFLCERMRQLRVAHNLSMEEMAKKIDEFSNKSNISRVESGKMSKKKTMAYFDKYCEIFKLTNEQITALKRAEKIAIPDLKVLFANPRIIDSLNEEYNKVVIPDFVLKELDEIKYRNEAISKKAWQIKNGIILNEKIICKEYLGTEDKIENKMMELAKAVLNEFGVEEIHIYTDEIRNTSYTKLKGNDRIKIFDLSDYASTKNDLLNMDELDRVNALYLENYDDVAHIDSKLATAYLRDGNTLITSAIYSNKPVDLVKKKIIWLMRNGADINQRVNCNNYFPPLTIAIQKNRYELFSFLLNECKANPNAGSRNPSGKGNFLTSNDGNMPLMVAAFHGREQFVKDLCNNPITSINQQDANGYTALMKAAMRGYINCVNILLDNNADKKIVDRNGHDFDYWVNYYYENQEEIDEKKNYKKKKN